MTVEEKREYLKNYRIQYAKIRRLKEMMEICPDKKDKYLLEIKSARKLRDRIETEIENVDGGILSEILSLKYMCGKSLEEISYEMNYCKRQIERLHIRALEKFSTLQSMQTVV